MYCLNSTFLVVFIRNRTVVLHLHVNTLSIEQLVIVKEKNIDVINGGIWREGGNVWKGDDRTGYAQTESQAQAQAQTWEPYLSLKNASPLIPFSVKNKHTHTHTPVVDLHHRSLPSMLLLTYRQSPSGPTPPFLLSSNKQTYLSQTELPSVLLRLCERIQGVGQASK